MLVRYFMTSEVITLSPEQRCLDVLQLFRKHRIRRAPVLNNGQLVGIVSERDLYRVLPKTLLQASQENETGKDLQIKDAMTAKVHIVNPNDHLEMTAFMMLKYKIGGMPVVKDGQIKGLITESDIFKAMWSILSYKSKYRILFNDKGHDKNRLPKDYAGLCLKHHCLVNTFLSYPNPDGGYMHYICIQGAGGDDFIKDLWAHSCEIIFVERDDNSPSGPKAFTPNS